jgi:tetratricopeptide (TPR) repeat protein
MKNLLLTILLVLPNIGIGQDYGNNADAMKLCSVLQKNSFGTDVDAENALDKILNVIGASKRFVLQPCANINNAVATSFKGIRYILYDKNFMNSINYGNNWGNLFVLAHEVGHHINGHSVDLVLYAAEAVEPKSLAIKRQQELEADEFAGFILSKLGGPISAANQSISKLSTNSDDTYSTHPSRSKRLAAVKKGYDKASSSAGQYSNSNQAEEFFYKGVESEHKDKKYEAFGFYTKAIQLKSSISEAYNQRAKLQFDLFNNLDSAIEDITKAIELSPQYGNYYYNRSIFYKNKGELQLFYNDLNKVIELNPNDETTLFVRGNFLLQSNYINEAILDFDRVININGNNAEAYYSRALAKLGLEGMRAEACDDAKKSLTLGRTESKEFLEVMCK